MVRRVDDGTDHRRLSWRCGRGDQGGFGVGRQGSGCCERTASIRRVDDSPGRHDRPVVDRQTVQGFSAVIAGPAAGTYDVIIDNGFGTKANSADSLLRVYTVRPGFRTAAGGDGTVSAADHRTGAALPSFTPASYITLRDPDKKLGFRLVADLSTYPGVPTGIPVAPAGCLR